MKDDCRTTRDVNKPYEVYRNRKGTWEWRVLKKYQSEEKEYLNPNAKWFVAVKSPFTGTRYDIGDCYIHQIIAGGGVKVSSPNVDRWN